MSAKFATEMVLLSAGWSLVGTWTPVVNRAGARRAGCHLKAGVGDLSGAGRPNDADVRDGDHRGQSCPATPSVTVDVDADLTAISETRSSDLLVF